MSFVHGSRAVFQLGTSGTPATPVAISEFLNSVGFPRERETGETHGFGATAKSYLPGLGDATISLEGRFHTTIDAHLAGIDNVPVVAFVYGPGGSASGAIRYSGNCILTSYEPETGVDDVASFSAELQVTGAITRGVW